MSAPPGWHLQGDGHERYWDGRRWTDAFRDPKRPAQAPAWSPPPDAAAGPVGIGAEAAPVPLYKRRLGLGTGCARRPVPVAEQPVRLVFGPDPAGAVGLSGNLWGSG